MTVILECHNLTKSFDKTTVVQSLSLSVKEGQFITLVGPSGCGKTTTLRLIAGFESLDSGSIVMNGQVIAGNNIHMPPEKRRIGMVFQDYALFPHLNVADNIAFGLNGTRLEKQQRVSEMLDLIGLFGLEKRMPNELSGGQQQRIALARALAPRPQILLLDEPFSNLDAALRIQVRAEVRKILKQAGITSIFVTHDQEEALSLSDEVAIIFNGKVTQFGSPQTVYTKPESPDVAMFVGESNFLPGEAHGQYATCTLGNLPLLEPKHGTVNLLIRPEMLDLKISDSGCEALVEWIEFYGHDQRVGIRLLNGTSLIARADAWDTIIPNQTVYVSVNRAVQAF